MKESIARPIRKLDETKALFGVEPFDYPTDRRTGRGLEPRLAETGSGAECAGLAVRGISVKLATPRIMEILVSRRGFLEGSSR